MDSLIQQPHATGPKKAIHSPQLIDLGATGHDDIGYLTVAEHTGKCPFEIKRVYWTYAAPEGVVRGHHAHLRLQQILCAVSGRIDVELESVTGEKSQFTLNSPALGLFVPEMYWRTIRFSKNATLLCLASGLYDESDYIRNYEDFQKLRLANSQSK